MRIRLGGDTGIKQELLCRAHWGAAGSERKCWFFNAQDAEDEVDSAYFSSVKPFSAQDPRVLWVFAVLELGMASPSSWP